MKKNILVLAALIFQVIVYAQAPDGIQYQAVIRDANGDPMLNTSVQFKFSIENNAGSQLYYSERQAVSSNALGSISLVIGKGTVVSGNFSTIKWYDGDVRIRVELDPAGGQNFSSFGITSFQSVPYALFAQQAHSLVDDNGNEWVPEDDRDEQILTVNGNQLTISNGNSVVIPTGSGGDAWGSQVVETNLTLAGEGTTTDRLRIAQQGAVNGDVLKWNGVSWLPQSDNGTNYSEGTGINISGTTISAENTQALWNANQLQNRNVSLTAPSSGQVLKYDGANWSPGTDNGQVYTNGTGITIGGSTISATNTLNIWNANMLQNRPVENTAPNNGQVLKWDSDDMAWGPANDNPSYWSASGSNIYYNIGNVGIGTSAPQSKLHIANEEKIQMDDQTFGKWASVSLEYSSNLVPETDDLRALGTSTRRWTSVYATDGTINTSDAREKTNIKDLEYGLDELMKLRPVSYNWIARPETGTKLGLIAQEVETILPEVVLNPKRTPSILESEEVGVDRLGMYYSDLIPVLIKSIQEQQEQIKQLQAEVALLKKG